MKVKTILIGLICLAVAAWVAKIGYFEVTDGFSLANISSSHGDSPQWEISAPNADETAEINQALNQNYSYLAKGHQAYVFESQDKRYVLKFLKFQKYRHHPIVQALPWPAIISEKLAKQAQHKVDKQEALFNSWKIAYSKLKNETLVLLIHLNYEPIFNKTITLYNKMGMPYSINLGDYVFMLQRKVEMFGDVIDSNMKEGNIESAKHLLNGLVDLYKSEYRQGIYEQDRYIVRNTGVLAQKPIQIDTGRLRESDLYKEPKRQAKEIVWKTSLLQEWLDETYPVLGSHFRDSLKALYE